MSIWPIHIFDTKRRLILACMNKPFGELRHLARFAERQAQLPPQLANCNWIEKVSTSWQRYSALSSVCPRQTDATEKHDGFFVKECYSIWRVELVNIWTMSICPTHIFVTKRRLILACMNKPFREFRYLAVPQRGRRSCPHSWLIAIESKRCQHLGKGTQPFLLSVLMDKKTKRIKDNSMTRLLWKNAAKCEGWNLSTSGL